MFIRLTRLDNRPVWLNASFIVTVEPRRDGNGAIVVPIGDGLDYDVRESPEAVLAMLEGAPVPAVVPVPVSDCLTKTPDDVSPVKEQEPVEPTPTAKKSAEQKSVAKSDGEKPAEKKTRKRTTRAKAKPAEKKAPAADTAESTPEKEEEPTPAKIPELELSPDQVARLAKLAPKSVGKLKNTLATQFHVADVGGTVLALEAKGAFALEGNRVVWPAPLADW